MCGICGLTSNNREVLQQLNRDITHRGPDGEGTYLADGVSLGHRRLAIIDLNERSNQPLHSTDGRYVMVYNGELYNFKELKAEIGERYKFVTEGDGEVVLAAYSLWGKDMLAKLEGMFAFALWDQKEQKLFAARDQMGIKPFYYTTGEHGFAFSSELSGLMSVSDKKLDQKALAHFLGLNYSPTTQSLVSGIKKLPAGHYLEYQKKELSVTEYFNVFAGDDVEPINTDLYETIGAAVKKQLVADRPVGVFLSGGIDSSIVLHHASEVTDQVRTYSVKYEMTEDATEQASKFNADADLAEKTAAHYNANHTTYTISIEDIQSGLESAIQSLDEPVANPTAIAQYLLSKWVRDDGTVVALGGDGGDELFGGYTRHRAMMAAHYYSYIPHLVRSLLSKLHPKLRKLSLAPGLPLHTALMTNKTTPLAQVLKQSLPVAETVRETLSVLYSKTPIGLHPLDQFMRVDRRTWLVEESLTRSDRSSMAHGLELRVPLLDIAVVRLADTISPFRKTTPWTGKKILRKLYRGHLPKYLYNQPKRGWISPGAKWFRDPVINKFINEVFSDEYYDGLSDVVDWEAVRHLLDEHVNQKGYYLQPLWNLLVLQIWARHNKVKA